MKDEVMTNIVSLLESDETFAEIVEKILREAERYLCTSHAAVLQVSTDGKLINTVISYAGEGELPLKINNIPKSKFSSISRKFWIDQEPDTFIAASPNTIFASQSVCSVEKVSSKVLS